MLGRYRSVEACMFVLFVSFFAGRTVADVQSHQEQTAPQNSPSPVGNVAVPGRGGVSFPSCASCPEPLYTDGARKRRVYGTVHLEVLIQPNGRATNIQVTQSLDPELDKQAVKAVRDWRFKPAVGPDGKPVGTQTILQITFRLLDREFERENS